jgi:hypothetical protein
MYRGINRANVVVARVPAVAMDSARRAALVGEAKFVRALNYLNLVRYWGAVPLRLTPSEGFDNLAAPRAPADSVYRQVLADLREAEAVLPDAAANGRATRWAAKALIADVHLGRGDWALAAAKAKEVIDSRRFSLVAVRTAADFDQLFGADVDTSPEELFDVPFTRDGGSAGTELPAMLHHASAGYAANAYRALYANMKSFVGAWDRADLRYQYGMYTGADARWLTATEPQRFRKFRDPRAIVRQAHGNDFHVLRYADVLTTFAEAESQANGGPTPAAYDAINRVRRRAYGLDVAAPSARDLAPGLGAQAFRDAVLLERAYEFTAEGRRYWDLKRTGTLEAAVRAAGKAYNARYLLWPIPQDELTANKALTPADQNPGW